LKIGFVGLGNMGSAMANLICENGYDVCGWDFHKSVVREINAKHSNSKYFPIKKLCRKLTATDDLCYVLGNCGMIFIALPSIFIKKTMEVFKSRINERAIIVNLAKGISSQTGETAFHELSHLFPRNQKVMLSGPSIANEIAQRFPTVVILAGKNPANLKKVSKVLENEHFRTKFSPDVIGAELGGILKNIYAIGLGIFDGYGISSINFRSIYLTLALKELRFIGVKMGGRNETFSYVSGLGDLFATSLSEHSHNRRLGELISKGRSLDSIRESMGILPEGYNTLKTFLKISGKLKIKIPVARGLNDIIEGKLKTAKFIENLLSLEDKYEVCRCD
jgi:glycerol-3-phosphate dehydrogenase (NAD(P)+)